MDPRELGAAEADLAVVQCLEVFDVDGFVAELRAAGVIVLAEPANQVWGERVAYVEDPDGNPVHIRAPVAGGS